MDLSKRSDRPLSGMGALGGQKPMGFLSPRATIPDRGPSGQNLRWTSIRDGGPRMPKTKGFLMPKASIPDRGASDVVSLRRGRSEDPPPDPILPKNQPKMDPNSSSSSAGGIKPSNPWDPGSIPGGGISGKNCCNNLGWRGELFGNSDL